MCYVCLLVPAFSSSFVPVPHKTSFVGARIINAMDQLIPTAPYVPSPMERRHFYYGIYSRPALVARSSYDLWVAPTGAEAYMVPKECKPAGISSLNNVWEDTLGRAMGEYLQDMGVQVTSLDPIRIGKAGDESPPLIIWVGVIPGSLAPDAGIKAAIQCKAMLEKNSFNDIHVEIRESQINRSAKMYRPVSTSDPTAKAREPFSTSLGIPICAETTPNIEGTAAFFFSAPRFPGKLFLLTARHVLFHPDEDRNELYVYHGTGDKKRAVLLLGEEGFETRKKRIETQIRGKQYIIDHLQERLSVADRLENEGRERKEVLFLLEKENTGKVVLQKFLDDAQRDWTEKENRVIGHAVLSPPIRFNVGERGQTQDWAIIEVDQSKIDDTNFVGNCIDLGPDIAVDVLTDWMYPHPANPPSFKYPHNRLLKFHGKLSDKEMEKPDPKTIDQHQDPVAMVLKNGATSGVTVGRLNTIDSFIRVYFKGKPSEWSREVAVLPHGSRSGPFSDPGDSGSAVVAGDCRLVGLLTGGAGSSEVSDVTYVTSIDAILEGLAAFGYNANLYPAIAA